MLEIASTVIAGRRNAESRMTSTVTIHRGGVPTTDENGFEVEGYAAVATGVPFRLGGSRSGDNASRTVTIGGTEVQVAVRVGHLPADTEGLRDSDLLEITDGEHAGVVLQVVEATGADQQTALRVPVFEVRRPETL